MWMSNKIFLQVVNGFMGNVESIVIGACPIKESAGENISASAAHIFI